MAEVGQNVSDSWPKWQIALGIGVPTVLGLAGVWYILRRRKAQAVKGFDDIVDPEKGTSPKPAKTSAVTEDEEKVLVSGYKCILRRDVI